MSVRTRIVDGIFGTLELLAAGYDFIRGLRKRIRRDTDPIPLTHKDSERIAELGRRAGHETDTFRDVDSGRYTSRLADAKPGRLPKPPRVPRI